MEIPNLLKSQANQIYLTLAEKGWNPSDFEWQIVPTTRVPPISPKAAKIIHKATNFYFLFDDYAGSFTSEWSPSFQTLKGRQNVSQFGDQIIIFIAWLGYLKREYLAPNLWEEMPSDTKLIESASNDDENSKFTAAEKKTIITGIEEIKQYLLTAHRLDPELVESQMKYLVESSTRLGRKDWKNVVVSSLFSIILAAGLNSHIAQEIFQFAWTILSTVLIQKLYLP